MDSMYNQLPPGTQQLQEAQKNPQKKMTKKTGTDF